MPKRVQLIRHTTGGADAFVGYEAEITVDTTVKELRLHDGLTAGGIPQARKDLANVATATTGVAGKMSAADKVELAAATAEIVVNAAAIVAETAARVADVNTEEARAIAAEGVLQGNIDTEASTRGTDDVTLQGNIDAEIANRIADVDAEEARALAAEGLLAGNITTGDAAVQANVDAEETARIADVDAEEAARIAADAVLQTNINAIPAYVVNLIYPVGALYIGAYATNPAIILGEGTWALFGQDRVMIGAGNLYGVGATGGSKDAVNISHSHTFAGNGLPTHDHDTYAFSPGGGAVRAQATAAGTQYTDSSQAVSAGTPSGNISTDGVAGANLNLPPYISVYMWIRTS